MLTELGPKNKFERSDFVDVLKKLGSDVRKIDSFPGYVPSG